MSAHIHALPRPISFVGNEMIVTLESDNITPDRAYIEFTLTDYDGPVVGESVSITYRDTAYTFVFAATPNNSGWQLPTRDNTQTPEQWWAYLAERLRINPRINTDFDITMNIVAFSIRLSWRVTEPLSITQTNNLSYLSVTAHSVASIVFVENLSASISVHDAISHQELTQRVGLYDITNKKCSFDIQSAFSDLQSIPLSPAINTATTAETSFKSYYIRYADRYGAPPQSEIRHKTQNLTAIAGGTASQHSTPFFRPNAPLLALHNWANNVLAKPITKTQPDWLYFIAINNEPNLTWDVTFHYAAGYRSHFTTNAQFSCAQGEVKCLPVGFQQLGLHNYTTPQAFSTSFIVAYDIHIRRPNGDALLTASFAIEPYHPWNTYLVFDNGLGGIESVRLKGKKQINYSAEAIIIEKKNGDLSNAFATASEMYDVSTGWYEYNYLRNLRQLLLGRAWLLDTTTGEYTDIIAEKQTFEFVEDDNDLHALNFKFRTAKTETRVNNY